MNADVLLKVSPFICVTSLWRLAPRYVILWVVDNAGIHLFISVYSGFVVGVVFYFVAFGRGGWGYRFAAT